MSIITTLNFRKSCRYYICKYRSGDRVECIKYNKKEFNDIKSRKDKNDTKKYIEYCTNFEYLDKFRLCMDNLNLKMPIIKQN